MKNSNIIDVLSNREKNVYFHDNSLKFNIILDVFLTTKSVISAKNEILKDSSLMLWILAKVPQLENYNIYTKLNWILSGRTEFPVCQKCGNILPEIDIPVFGKYKKWCSRKCMNSDLLHKEELGDRLEAKYGKGVRHNFQIPGIREEVKKTWEKKYGTPNPFELAEIKEKKRRTFIERYSVDNNMKCESGLDEYRLAIQKKYGVDYTWQAESVQKKSR